MSVALLVSFACNSAPAAVTQSAAPSDVAVPPVQYEAKPASVDGYVFTNAALSSEAASADGWRIGGVALTRDASAPAAGFTPFTGNIDLVDAISNANVASTKPDAQGLAKFTNVAAGRYRVRMATTPTREFPLTLVGGATVRWGSYPVSRAKAYDGAKQLVASAIRPDATLIASPQTPLPAGVVVSPALGDDNGQQAAPLDITLAKASWFFYVDPFTDQKFHHPVKFVFVDAETGQATTKDEDSWPAFNRASYYRHNDDLAKSPDVLMLPSNKPPTSTAPVRNEPLAARGGPAPKDLAPRMFDHVPNCSNPVTYALMVQGADEGPQRADMDQMKGFFGHGGIPPASVYQWKPSSSGQKPSDEIDQMWAKIKAAATPCDYVFVFVTAHGTRSGNQQLDTTATEKDGTPIGFQQWSPARLDWNNCRACHITIIVDSCYSGALIPQLMRIFQGRYGSKVVVMTSSDSRHESGSYDWYNPRGRTGGAFTNSLVDAFNAQTQGGAPVNLGSVYDAANTDVAGTAFTKAIREQNPQYWERKLQPGETCQQEPSGTKNPPTTPAQTQNKPPKITHFVATFSRPVTTYTVEASDPDGDPLTYTWSSNAFCGTFSGAGTTATWSHPDKSLGGNCPDEPVHAGAITVTVSDGKGGTDTYTWTRGSDVGEARP